MSIPGMLEALIVVVELATGTFIALIGVSARVGAVVMSLATAMGWEVR